MSKTIQLLKKAGWELEEHSDKKKLPPMESVSLHQFVSDFEEYSTWDVMLHRAKEANATYSQAQAELLLENQNKIPESWRAYNIIFPGTVWKSRTRQLHTPFLTWMEGGWHLDLYWFLYDFHHNDRFIIQSHDLN